MLSFYELRKEENFRDRLKESWRKLSEAQRVKLEEMIVRTAELNEGGEMVATEESYRAVAGKICDGLEIYPHHHL